jgi:predicted TIM-barrel fold metal-dependent hydrolase
MNLQRNIITTSRHVSDMGNDTFKPLGYKPISGDSHVTEPPHLYKEYMDPKFRDRAPHMELNAKGGSIWVIDGIYEDRPYTVGMGTVAGAGVDPKLIKMDEWKFEDVHKGGHDPKARIADQDKDDIGGEILFPTVGMVLCNHPDLEFKQACFTAYNRWLQEFQSHAPDRLLGLGQSAVSSVKQTVADLAQMKEMGFVGAMFPMDPGTDFEYDDPQFDPVWQASIDLKLPICFHILTSKKEAKTIVEAFKNAEKNRGRNMSFFHHTLIRANQDLISTFVWGRVFERFPKLRLVCAEADAGWVPHFMYRADHFYNRHRFHSKVADMDRRPSEQIADNIYFTFQDDLVAFNVLNMLNPKRLLWSNDFPHPDATWPYSRQLITYQTGNLTDEQRRWICRDNHIAAFDLKMT